MAAAQLTLIHRDDDACPTWADEGAACTSCPEGQLYMVVASDPCTCDEARCICLAEGYARCDSCGDLSQVFPRDMVAIWRAHVDHAS